MKKTETRRQTHQYDCAQAGDQHEKSRQALVEELAAGYFAIESTMLEIQALPGVSFLR